MIIVRQVKVDVLNDSKEMQKQALAKKMHLDVSRIKFFSINKQSLDARDKMQIFYVYEFKVEIANEEEYFKKNKSNDILLFNGDAYHFVDAENINDNVVIVGAGPAGLFCAYILAENGYHPLIIERGKCVEERQEDVKKFWEEGILNPESNVQFGEGGAGTFSDGKLNTLIKDDKNRMRKVFETFVKFGANEDILYSYKPHVGTDVLRNVIINMRKEIIKMGGKFLYNTCLTDIICENNLLKSIIVNKSEEIKCDALVLAIGHSARDTVEYLYKLGLKMENKPFAVGLRIQHDQQMINVSQYGEEYANKLGAAAYKVTYKASTGKGVYSFCMCPGGFVINASSEEGLLAINGMSNRARDEKNANSAIIVTVDESDYGFSPLAGIYFQRTLEKKAYELGKGMIPVQLLKDYKLGKVSNAFGTVSPIIKGNYYFADLNALFSNKINQSLKESFEYFGKKIKNFDQDSALLAGVESRTSSPVKILRDDNFEANILGIYPCGEGAGYAGGITSSAVDGIKVAEAIAKHKN